MTKVSVIIPFYNAQKYLMEAIESIVAQKFSFDNISLFLIDDGSTDESPFYGKVYAQRYTNVKYVRQEHLGVSAARNKGIELALDTESEFVFFLDADDKYNKKHINDCINILEKYPESVFVSGVARFFEKWDNVDPEYLLPVYEVTREINTLENNTDAMYVGHVAQGGWRAAVLENYRFNENFAYSEDIDFICRILLENKFVFSEKIEYLYRIRHEQDSVVNQGSKHVQWYDRVWNIYKPLYEESLAKHGHVPFFIQHTIVKNLQSLFTNKEKCDMIPHIDYEQLNQTMCFIMQHTDDNILESELIEYWQKIYFLQMKYGEPNVTRWAPIPTFVMNHEDETDMGKRFGYLNSDPLVVHMIEEKRGILTIRASLRCITYKHFELDVVSDFAANIEQVTTPFDIDKTFFANKEIFPRQYYEIKVDLHKACVESSESFVRFFLKTDYGVRVNIRLETLPLSGLWDAMPFTLGDEFIIKRTAQNNTLEIASFSEKELINVCSHIAPYNENSTPEPASVQRFHVLTNEIFNLFRTFANKRIWIFMDRGNEIGNNAEVLFRDCVHRDDGIQKYYIIPDESYAERFAGLPYMVFGTLEYKLLCCFAEKFISSFLFDEGLTLQFGVEIEEKELYEDIQNFKRITKAFFRGDIIHLQHGVIMQDISFYLNKFNENTHMLCNVSEKEYDYVTTELSHAIDKNVPKLTGLPKYDLLEKTKKNSFSQKMILFAPSFDRQFNSKGKYREDYKHSDHFKYINDIVNSKSFVDMLEENGYMLCFKPHYILLQQMDDFQIDSRIQVITDEIDRYDLYAMTDLMITDYSGVAFEFAYLEKSVIYAHFLENPKYDETYFSYEKDGFGDICHDMDGLTNILCDNIAKACIMPDKYKSRVDDFYTFHDEDNCKRVYEEILKMPDTRKDIFK
jgi:Putative glycosyl/glycerophosphate transferases involved in teichoic acid biosynthesis TagF/TagB/EpsJ/RodC